MSDLETMLRHLPPAMLVVFRIGGLMVLAPALGSSVIPVRVRVFLALTIGLAVYPVLASRHFDGVEVELELLTLAPLIAMEVLIGIAIGLAASLPLVGAQAGGLIMGQQMGLGFAQFYNPAIDDEGDVVGQILFFMALAGFLLVGGHDAMVLALLHSFAHVPLGGFEPNASVLALLAGLLLAAFELALRVAAPLLALIFLQSVAMGFISKTIPQFNILSLGFPIRILAGLLIIGVGLIVIDDVIMDAIDHAMNAIFAWIESAPTAPS